LVQGHVVIDVPAYARALGALAGDPSLRARMGEAGRRHVAASLDWSRVIPRYLDLARDLAERRAGARATTPPLRASLPNPLEMDPFEAYADYPTAVIAPDTPVHPGPNGGAEFLELADRLSGRELYRRRLVAPDLALRVQAEVAARPGLTVTDLAGRLDIDPVTAASAVLSLAKADALRLPEAVLRA
jgi:hypothetical protein